MIQFVAADPAPPLSHAGSGQLALAALAGIAVVVLAITIAKIHPFIGLILGSATLAAVAAVPGEDAVKSFTTGFGNTTGSVGLLVALGAMIGQILTESGGGNVIVDRLVLGVKAAVLPWMMALVAAIIGLPMFFEIGVVLLIPIVMAVARKSDHPAMYVGIPALAGLSILHALVPPHPGPLAAIDAVGANIGTTLMFGVVIAIPTLIIAGPLLSRLVVRLVPIEAPAEMAAVSTDADDADGVTMSKGAVNDKQANGPTGRPSFASALLVVLLPVVLMLASALLDVFDESAEGRWVSVVKFLGTPSVALTLAVIAAMFALGLGSGMSIAKANSVMSDGLPAVAGIILIVAAGGGFKQLLVDAGVGNVIKDWAEGRNLSPLLLGWLVAVGIRLATGSATVATITAAGIVSPMVAHMSTTHGSLMVLAIGCGSVFFSHVNDAGFWLVKEYFGMTVVQTLKSWSLMETVISVVGFAFVACAWAVV